MAEKKVIRKLAAILVIDMVGYSRLMGADEAGTIARQKAHRAELIDPKIAEYNGRIVKTTGDGLLVEFASAVDAVLCAVAVQRGMAEREAEVAQDRRIAYRVGINLGEIVIDGEDILGDGVNVAARLEALAEPGGIRISEVVFKNVKGKLDLGFADLGPQKVKNIAEPVPTYRVLLDPIDVGKVVALKRMHLKAWRWATVGAISAMLLVAAGMAWWQPWVTRVEPARLAKMAFPLPKRPSIAVLPFANMSGDKTQDYLADGLSENIITALSKVSEMFVIARNSTFTYKGKPVKVQRVAEELGVRYVLEGSIQKSGDRIRVTAQLIDALTGRHLWSERYDRKLTELFAVQDEITLKIVAALQVKLTEGEQARVRGRSTDNLQAWGYFVRGQTLFRRIAKSENARSRRLLKRAIELDRQYAAAWGYLAWTHWWDARLGWSKSRAKSFRMAEEALSKAIALDPADPRVHNIKAFFHLYRREYDRALAAARKALELGSNMAYINANSAYIMRFLGNWDEVIELSRRAVRLSPHAPNLYFVAPGVAHVHKREYDLAIAVLEQGLRRPGSDNMRSVIQLHLAFAHSEAGRLEIARKHMVAALKLNPRYSAPYVRRVTFYKNPAHLERELDALRKAGLPEHPPARLAKMAFPLPKKASIAVLPFTNMSGDKTQDYLADGLSENIIAALSKASNMFVIARNSTFVYKGKAVPVRRVAETLGVRYVLEGSIQKSGERIRVTAQLIDAVKGHHLWSERYDRKLTELFAVQDEITLKIVKALSVKLTAGELVRLGSGSTKNLRAMLFYMKGRTLFLRFTKENNAQARKLYERAIQLDPQYVGAWTGLGGLYWLDARYGWTNSPAKSRQMAMDAAKRALTLNPNDPGVHSLLGILYLDRGEHDRAIAEGRKAIGLAPSVSEYYASLAVSTYYAGEFAETVALTKKAMRLHPRYPSWYAYRIGVAYMMLGRYEESVAALKAAHDDRPIAIRKLALATTFSMMGRIGDARALISEVKAADRSYTLTREAKSHFFKNPAHLKRIIAALSKAGLPE